MRNSGANDPPAPEPREPARGQAVDDDPDVLLEEDLADLGWVEREDATEAPPAWFGRGRFAIFAVAAVCVANFVAANTGADAGSRSHLLALGAISYATIQSGELWRLLAAVFVHFDIGHLLANMSALAVLGPPLAHQVGGARFLVVFLVGGIGANVVSHLIAPTVGLKAGASGGIAAVLGALGAQGVRPQRRTRYKQWQILGALAAFYGLMIGFGPGRDNVAHLAGAVIGFLVGRVTQPLPPESRPGGMPRIELT